MNISRIALVTGAAVAWLGAAVPAQAADSDWNRKVSQLIAANYSYPRSAQLKGEQGKAKIKIAIAASGKVMGVDLVQSSGSEILDREAVRIPSKVGSFPPPPTHSNVELIFPITFRMDE